MKAKGFDAGRLEAPKRRVDVAGPDDPVVGDQERAAKAQVPRDPSERFRDAGSENDARARVKIERHHLK